MSYSKFHKNKNPFSPARLDEAFKASKMEGGPGDPVKGDKVKVTKNVDEKAGTVTITKSSKGEDKKLTPEEKEAANARWANMSEEQKQAARDRKAQREALSSFTYKKLDYHDSMPMELMDEDIDIKMAPPPDDYLPPSEEPTESYTYTTSETKKKKKKDTVKHPKIKDDGLSKTCSEDPTACIAPIGDQSKKALRGAERKRKMEIKASKKRDRQIERGKFAPKQWFEEKMYQRDINKSRNQVKKERAKKTRKSNRERSRNTPIKDFFNDLSINKKPKSRTIKASF